MASKHIKGRKGEADEIRWSGSSRDRTLSALCFASINFVTIQKFELRRRIIDGLKDTNLTIFHMRSILASLRILDSVVY